MRKSPEGVSVTKSKNIGLRLSPEDLAKLDAIAAETHRQRNDVVRLLISGARALKVRDIAFDGEDLSATAAVGSDN
jgi:hypothetical protein